MKLNNFIFRGLSLKEKGYMRCYFNGADGVEISQSPSLSISTAKSPNNDRLKKINSTFESPINLTFQICKNSCKQSNLELTNDEIRDFKKWLTGYDYEKVVFIDTLNEYFSNGIFTTINDIVLGEKVIGFEVTLNTNLPYLLVDKTINFETSIEKEKIVCPLDFDSYGYHYPSLLSIETKSSGNLKIESDFEDRYMYLSECIVGEIITLDCENKIISTNKEHSLSKHFNFKYLRLKSNYGVNNNIFTVSIPCKIKIVFNEIRKVALI